MFLHLQVSVQKSKLGTYWLTYVDCDKKEHKIIAWIFLFKNSVRVWIFELFNMKAHFSFTLKSK